MKIKKFLTIDVRYESWLDVKLKGPINTTQELVKEAQSHILEYFTEHGAEFPIIGQVVFVGEDDHEYMLTLKPTIVRMK